MAGRDDQSDPLRAWVVTADMGLGHQRAVYPLRDIAHRGIVTLGESGLAEPGEARQWQRLRNSYETLSRLKSVPIIGNSLFRVVDSLQNIPPFYPIRDMSKPTYQVGLLGRLLDAGLCAGYVNAVEREPLPSITSFYAPSLALDRIGYARNYCILPDAEVSRAWIAPDPMNSKVTYLAPCGRTVKRLHSYGVPDDRIFLTGFPMPLELIGDTSAHILRYDCGQRLRHLDPAGRFWPLHERNVVHFLGRRNCALKRDRVLTVSFCVGGAGAQVEIGIAALISLRERLQRGELRLNLIAGVREEVRDSFARAVREAGLGLWGDPDAEGPQPVRIVWAADKQDYFRAFTEAMRTTDVLWTKPSELSFYCGLGLPIIMAPTVGSQEEFNRRWLVEIQAGVSQEDPEYTSEWLFDLLAPGRLAEAAWDGFLKARMYGTYKVLEVLRSGTMERETSPLKR